MENDMINKGMISKVEFRDGEINHYLNGQLHRTDGPAIYHSPSDGFEEWYKEGNRHREDGPAIVIDEHNRLEYWLEGKLHRADNPAISDMYGNEEWFLDGKRHRKDGPAVTKVGKDGDTYETQYWIDGEQIIPDDVEDCKPCGEEKEALEECNISLAHNYTKLAVDYLLNEEEMDPEYVEIYFMLKIVENRMDTYRQRAFTGVPRVMNS